MGCFGLHILALCLSSLAAVIMASTNSSFGSTSLFNNIQLQVTNEKLTQLKSQQDWMRDHFTPVLDSVGAGRDPNTNAALTLLYNAIRDAPIKNMIREEQTLLDTLRYFIVETERDPSISQQIMGVWVAKLKQEIEFAIRKCEYSYLYGSFLSEWLDEENKSPQEPELRPVEPGDMPSVAPSKDKALEELQTLMFTLPVEPFDKMSFMSRLRDEVFNVSENAGHQQLLEQLRQEIRNHFYVSTHRVQVHSLRSCIDGLNSEDYVAPDKKIALRQLKENSEVLSEVATLLTNRIRHLHLWNWTAPNVKVSLELTRGLAGQWRAGLTEDVISMLLNRYIGVEWASKFKSVFLRLYDAMGKKAGGDQANSTKIAPTIHRMSINGFRDTNYRTSLLSELPDSMHEQRAKNPSEYVEVESEEDISPGGIAGYLPPAPGHGQGHVVGGFSDKKVIRPAHRPPPPQQPPIDFRQSFLHVLSTEIKLSHTIRPAQPFIVVQSNFENFQASLLHEPVLALLEFFHVRMPWLDFFTKFLHTPVEDRVRLRGIPESHIIGSFFGEIALFALDFNINQATGINVHRVQDHFWLWGNDLEKTTEAWLILEEFGTRLGLRVNAKKSGSVFTYAQERLAQVTKVNTLQRNPGATPLPQGSVRWAYLQLDSSGRFTIDKQAVKGFTGEMKGLLDKAAGSTLQYINIYNKYMEFFVRNFGKNALVFGGQHVEQVVDALRQIHEQLFEAESGSAVQALKTRAKLPSEIVDAWVYWPLERGGLGLMNPFLEIMALHHKYEETYNGTHANADASELEFAPLLLQDRNNYDEHMRVLEERNKRRAGSPGYIPENIPTFEEYIEERESGSRFEYWYRRYVKLLERPIPLEPPTITRGGPLANSYWSVALNGDDEAAKKQMQWIFTYYEPQLARHFGTVQFINTELLPMSMISNIRKNKVKY